MQNRRTTQSVPIAGTTRLDPNRYRRKKINPIWWLVGTGGISLLCIGCMLLTLLALAFATPELYSALYRGAPQIAKPALAELKPDPAPPQDVAPPDGATNDTGRALDSQCPAGAPVIPISGANRPGTKAWFDALPKEPEQGIAICVYTEEYQLFLKAMGTYKGGLLDGKRLSGLDVLAYFYSYQSVGSDKRVSELKTVMDNLVPATMGGVKMLDTAWIMLPGFTKTQQAPTTPLCPEGNCFEQDGKVSPQPTYITTPTLTAFVPMQVTSTLTPMPTSMVTPTPPYVDLVLVPTLAPVTPQRAVATAMSNVSADEWLAMYEDARVYMGQHCQHIYTDLDFRTMGSSELWAYTTDLTWKNGQFGWMVEGVRRDVFVPNYGEYVIYSVCGQVLNVPSVDDIDGNGTQWRGGVSRFYPPGQPDPTTGLIHSGETYWVNVYGQWFAPAYPKPGALDPTPTPTPSNTPYPNTGILTVQQAINLSNNGLFDSWIAVTAGVYPTAANPKIEMFLDSGGRYWIDFTGYIGNIKPMSGVKLQLTGCGYPVSQNQGGFQIATNSSQGAWCITPGK